VVTEAGFGADLGAEKFFDIKCRAGDLRPAVAVIVATVRALKMHGGVPLAELSTENVAAVERGFVNLRRHIENVRKFRVPPIVAVNQFASDSGAELAAIVDACKAMGVPARIADVHGKGGEGAEDLARAVMEIAEDGKADFHPLYPLDISLEKKIETVAKEIYHADGVGYMPAARRDLERLESIGMGDLPVCMAKTQYSFSDDPSRRGAPTGFEITVRSVTPSAGAGFVVAHTGDIMTMPGLPKRPAAESMRVADDGTITGLF
jgi:formate--tetrahydrofolate ligase